MRSWAAVAFWMLLGVGLAGTLSQHGPIDDLGLWLGGYCAGVAGALVWRIA